MCERVKERGRNFLAVGCKFPLAPWRSGKARRQETTDAGINLGRLFARTVRLFTLPAAIIYGRRLHLLSLIVGAMASCLDARRRARAHTPDGLGI